MEPANKWRRNDGIRKSPLGDSLAVRGLGLCALTAEDPGLIPGRVVRELRSHKPRSMAKKKKERQKRKSPFGIQIIILDKDHQWILKLVGDSLMTNRIFTVLKYLPTSYLLIIKGKNIDFWKQPGKHLFHQVGQRDTTCLLM